MSECNDDEIADKDTFGIMTLVLGVISIIGCWIPFLNIVSMIIAISGIIIGTCSIVKFLRKKCKKCVFAIVGIILNIITICIGAIINNTMSDSLSGSSVFKTGDTEKQVNKSIENSKKTNSNDV